MCYKTRYIFVAIYCCFLALKLNAQECNFDWGKFRNGTDVECVQVSYFFNGKSNLLNNRAKDFFKKIAPIIKKMPQCAKFEIGIDAYTTQTYHSNPLRLNNIYKYLIELGCDSNNIQRLIYNSHDQAPPFPGHTTNESMFKKYNADNITLYIRARPN